MDSSVDTTASREEYLRSLKPATASTPDHDEKVCHSCMEEMCFLPLEVDANSTVSTQAEDIPSRAVTLHDRHILCEGCAREWLASANTCPECRKVLFEVKEEEVSNEPMVHLDSVDLEEWSDTEELNHLVIMLGSSFLDRDANALAYFTPHLISHLRERNDAYEEQNIFLDFEYPPYDVLARTVTVARKELETQACVVTQRAVVNLWAWWARRFFITLVNAEFDLRHHPLATSLLFQMLDALKRLPDGVSIKRPVLELLLSQRLTTFAKTRGGSAQAQDFEGYIGDMVEAALSATAGRMRILASKPHEARKKTYEALYETTSTTFD